ncbi:hypothetical protein SALCHL_004673 [Streptomyces albus subsp. chlorinus]|uniref:hypothetical protein n=1 Tax=Streptomyces albus TaxID=1888 RepID=UPI003D0A2AC0
MPGDEIHEGEGARGSSAPAAGGRTGPRHAAPRKPLLTRLHVPAGKAVALAAMPSAVLMGMGLTPQLANAKPLPKNPFKGDSCVSISERKETQKEKEERKERAEKLKKDLARAQAERQKAAEAARKAGRDGHSPGRDGDGATSPSAPSGGDASLAKPPESSTGSSRAKKPTDKPADDSTPSSGSSSDSSSQEEKNPWYDPLGLGRKLDDTFNPDKGEDKEEPAEKPSDEPTGEPGASPGADDPEPPSPGSGHKEKSPHRQERDAREKPGEEERGAPSGAAGSGKADGAGKGSQDAEGGKKAEDHEDSGKSKGSDEDGVDDEDGTVRDYDPAKDAGKPFPCPTRTHVEGKDEQTPAQVPNAPWYLEASSLTLKGLDYEGVVNITTPDGKSKQALKFTADALDIGDLHQIVKASGGLTYHVQAAKGSTSTIRGGKVTMYTEELKGNLFGLIPITFSPESPPPINVPFAYFTDVSVRQAGQFGGTLTIPGLHQYVRN